MTRLLYFADPMCSWSWGFAPVIERLVASAGDSLSVRPVMGGLAPGAFQPLSTPTKVEMRHHWEQARQQTGQTFDFEFFEREGFIYDTEPACRAVVAVRKLRPQATLGYLARVHEAFFAEGANPTDLWVLRTLAAEQGVDRDQFAACMEELDTYEETRADFDMSRELGVAGFPTLLGLGGDRPRVICQGFMPLDGILDQLDRITSSCETAQRRHAVGAVAGRVR